MKRIDKIYKQLLLREDFPPDYEPDVPTGTVQTYPGPGGTIYQDITVPNVPNFGSEPPPNPYPTPPRADPRLRDVIIKPYLKPPAGLHRGWDHWLPGADAPAYWPRTPTGLPLPRDAPPGWPNNQPWPPEPGHPLYEILQETYNELGWVFHTPPSWLEEPATGSQVWTMLPMSAQQKVLERIGIKLWEYNQDRPFMPIIPETLSWILVIAGWEGTAALWLWDLAGAMLPIHDWIQYIQDHTPTGPLNPNIDLPFVPEFAPSDIPLEILQWFTWDETAYPTHVNDPQTMPPQAIPPIREPGLWYNPETEQWLYEPPPNRYPPDMYPKQEGDRFYWQDSPPGYYYYRPGTNNIWWWSPYTHDWQDIGHRF